MIQYRKLTGYKYELIAPYSIDIDVFPTNRIDTTFYALSTGGNLLIRQGYCWDGCSGPTWDDDTNMRGGLLHDCGYQMCREGLIHMNFKDYFDKLFYNVLLEDGMSKIRAWYYYYAVKQWGYLALKKNKEIKLT